MFRPVCLQVLVSCRLSRHILWMGIANFILCPLIFLWQILYSFFRYAEVCYLSVLGNITEMILVICMLEFMYLHKHTCSILFFVKSNSHAPVVQLMGYCLANLDSSSSSSV